jgi:hypothetical protein
MNGFRKIFPTFLSHYATFFAKMAVRKVVPSDEFYYQLKLIHFFLLHPVYLRRQKNEKTLHFDSCAGNSYLRIEGRKIKFTPADEGLFSSKGVKVFRPEVRTTFYAQLPINVNSKFYI